MTTIESNNLSQSKILLMIERFVQNVISIYSNSQGVLKEDFSMQTKLGFLYQTIMPSLPVLLSVYKPDHVYSEYIEAFWSGCREHGLLNIDAVLISNDQPVLSLTPDKTIALVESIFRYTESKKFKRRAKDRIYQTTKNEKSLKAYATVLHTKYSKLLVVRVDFCYRIENQHLVGIDDVYQHLTCFIRKKGISNIFEHEAGYVWTIEQGKNKGYHIHAVFYFKGSNVQDDKYKAMQIGELWIEITNCLGYYYRSNNTASKKRFEEQETLGIGMIRRSNPMAVNNAIAAVCYLAKPDKVDQYLRMKPKGARTFQTGMPKQKRKKRGASAYRKSCPIAGSTCRYLCI